MQAFLQSFVQTFFTFSIFLHVFFHNGWQLTNRKDEDPVELMDTFCTLLFNEPSCSRHFLICPFLFQDIGFERLPGHGCWAPRPRGRSPRRRRRRPPLISARRSTKSPISSHRRQRVPRRRYPRRRRAECCHPLRCLTFPSDCLRITSSFFR